MERPAVQQYSVKKEKRKKKEITFLEKEPKYKRTKGKRERKRGIIERECPAGRSGDNRGVTIKSGLYKNSRACFRSAAGHRE